MHSYFDEMDRIAQEASHVFQTNSRNTTSNELQQDLFYTKVENLMNENHCLLNSIGVGHAALESIKEITSRHGLACKTTGAGGGGFCIALIRPKKNIDSVKEELCAAGFECHRVQMGVTGVTARFITPDEARLFPEHPINELYYI